MKFKGKFNKKFPQKVEKPKPINTVENKEITPLPDGMKSILSVNGYSLPKLELPPTILSMIRRDLVITPHVERPEYGTNVIPIKIYEETEKRIYMPRFYGISTFGIPVEDKLSGSAKIVRDTMGIKTFNPSIKLRENQIPIVDKVVTQLKTKYGGVLSCYCGFGKTLSALKICSLLNVKTAVICHTSDLMFQWKQEIEKLLPYAKIGLVQQDKCITEGKDIIIVSLKTLALKEFPVGLFDDIGLSIWDEIHLMVTQLFSKAFMKMITPYSLGLSATPFRKDQCEKIFYNFIGPITHYEKRGPNNTVRVDCIVYKAENLVIAKDFKDDIIYTTTVTGMCYSEERISFIAKIILKVVSQVGRKILVLSEYVQHLKDIKDAVEKLNTERLKTNLLSRPITCGLYIGEMNNDQRVVSRDCDVILGTYKIASVGMDIPDLNCLVLASPRKEIEQSVGRIFRKVGNLKPRVIDIIDDHPMFVSQGRVRKEFYKQYEFTIIQSKVDWKGKVSSQRVLFDVTNTKVSSSAKTIESLMSEASEIANSKESDEKDDSQQNIEQMFAFQFGSTTDNDAIQILPEEDEEDVNKDVNEDVNEDVNKVVNEDVNKDKKKPAKKGNVKVI